MPDGEIEERLLVAVVDENGRVQAYSLPKNVDRTLIRQIADIGASAKIMDYNRSLGRKPEDDDDEENE